VPGAARPAGRSAVRPTSRAQTRAGVPVASRIWKTPPPGGEPKHILIGLLCPIGDTLMATPALAAVRQRFPRASITVIVSASNAGILDGSPDITRRVLVPAPGEGSPTARFASAVRQISRERAKYDLVITLSAAGSFVALLAGLGGPQLKLSMPPLWWLLGGHSQTFRARHTVDHYLLAVAPLLDRPVTPDERAPRLYLTINDRSAARRVLRQHGLSPSTVLVTMHVGGEGFDGRKRWAPERFAEVANGLVERCDAHVLLIGGRDDLALAEETAALMPRGATVLAGATPLKVTAALIEQSSLFVGNDSGPLHMAAAVGTAAVGIFGPSDWRQFQPIGKQGYRQRVVHSDLPCSPCFRFVGNDPWWYRNPCFSRACLEAISPHRVLDAALELLERE
jgi:ADP-heptose:LPS heptosyltransferase